MTAIAVVATTVVAIATTVVAIAILRIVTAVIVVVVIMMIEVFVRLTRDLLFPAVLIRNVATDFTVSTMFAWRQGVVIVKGEEDQDPLPVILLLILVLPTPLLPLALPPLLAPTNNLIPKSMGLTLTPPLHPLRLSPPLLFVNGGEQLNLYAPHVAIAQTPVIMGRNLNAALVNMVITLLIWRG
jgi:hypothetical protein